MIIRYIKRSRQERSPRKGVIMRRNHKIGVLVAWRSMTGIPYFGWSLVNEVDGDKFDPAIGIELAKKKTIPITVLGSPTLKIPFKVLKEIPSFMRHVERYMKLEIPHHLKSNLV